MATAGKKTRILKLLALALILLLAVIVALPFVLDANQFRPQLESRLSSALGREVKLGKLGLSILSGSIQVEDISIADNPAFSRSPFLNAKALQVSIALKPLIFEKSVRIQGLTLKRPSISLIRSKSGEWNFSNLGNSSSGQKNAAPEQSAGFSGEAVSIKQLEIVDGQVALVHADEDRKPSIYNNVNLKVRNLSYATEFPFSLSAALAGEGTLKLNGKAGPLNRQDLMRTRMSAELEVKHFDLLASGFAAPHSGLAGIFDFTGSLNSDGGEVRSRGKATADKLQVVAGGSPASRPVSLQYAADYSLLRRTGNIVDTAVEIGKASANLSGNYEMKENNLSLKMNVHGSNMPVEDLTAMFPAFGIKLPKGAALKGGSLNANLLAEGPADRLLTSGTVEISRTRLTGFDLSGKMAAVATLAGLKSNQDTEIEKFASALTLSPAGIQVTDLQLVVPAIGALSGSGTMANDESLDFTMKALVKPGSGLLHVVKESGFGVPFFVRGTASNPKFVPDMKKAVGGLLGSVIGQGSKDGKTDGNTLQNSLRGLFKKQ